MQKLIQWVHHQTVNLIILGLLTILLLVSSGIQISSIFNFLGSWFNSTLQVEAGAEKAALLPLEAVKEELATPASSEKVLAYIQQFAPIAVEESRKFKVPASIILATALIISQTGNSQACKYGNNHFALPCTPDWVKESMTIKDACLKKYPSNWFSFRDFSHYLQKQTIEPQRLSIPDWTQLIENSSIGREGLGIEITRMIQQYELYHFD